VVCWLGWTGWFPRCSDFAHTLSLLLSGPCLLTEEGVGLMFGLKRIAKAWRESFVAGATNTGNATATVGDKLVLNWHGTPTQRDGVLQIFPVIRDKSMPGVELGNCADAFIASIHDGGMSPDGDAHCSRRTIQHRRRL
jgi:hypothetical protein